METLRKLLDVECDYLMKDETMDRFLASMTEVELKRGEPLIPYGKFDNNLYVVKKGIIRVAYFDGFKEVTFSFALPGTLLISYYVPASSVMPYTYHEVWGQAFSSVKAIPAN